MQNIKYTLTLLIVSFHLMSCTLNEQTDGLEPDSERTILFYLAGDNSLSDEVQDKIDSLVAAWDEKVAAGGHLLVYADTRGAGPRLMEIHSREQGTAHAEVIETYDEENSASVSVFERVLTDMCTLYPGRDYGLVLFSHGSGWLPEGTRIAPSAATRTVAADGNNEFELCKFASAIPNNQFSFIVFESCCMAGIEVAYELKNKAHYIIASSAEMLSPGMSPVYGPLLKALFRAAPDYTAAAESYYNYYDAQADANHSATVSVINTAELEPLKALLTSVESRVDYWDYVDRESVQTFDRSEYRHLVYDLGQYLQLLATEEERQLIDGYLEAAVLYQASTTSFMPGTDYEFAIEQHSGLTIYIPDPYLPGVNMERKKLKLFI